MQLYRLGLSLAVALLLGACGATSPATSTTQKLSVTAKELAYTPTTLDVTSGQAVETLLGKMVKTQLIMRGSTAPSDLGWNGSILLDPTGELHERYGARTSAAYLIRPDGYIGFRGQPASGAPVLAYLRTLFLLKGLNSTRTENSASDNHHKVGFL